MDPQQPDDGWLSFSFDAAPDVPVDVSPTDTPAWPDLDDLLTEVPEANTPAPPEQSFSEAVTVPDWPKLEEEFVARMETPEPVTMPPAKMPSFKDVAAGVWPELKAKVEGGGGKAEQESGGRKGESGREPGAWPELDTLEFRPRQEKSPDLERVGAPAKVIDPPFFRAAAAPREVEIDPRQGSETPQSLEVNLPRSHQEHRGTEAASARLDDQQREMGEALDLVVGSIVRHLEWITQTLYAHANRLDDLDSGADRRGAY